MRAVAVIVIVAVAAAVACSSSSAPRRDELRASERRDAGPRPVAAERDAAIAVSVAVDAHVVDAHLVDAPPPPLVIVDAPMAWSDERAALTLDYRRAHADPDATTLDIVPTIVVLHYTGGHSAKGTRGYFDNVRIEAARKDLARAGAVNVSAHFVVDRDGTIYQLQPPTRFARHCIGLNHVAIGVENVGDERDYPLTEAQVVADAALVRELVRRYHVTRLLGHHEVMALAARGDLDYVERDPKYRNDKPDPGARFMSAVRARLADLALAGAGR